MMNTGQENISRKTSTLEIRIEEEWNKRVSENYLVIFETTVSLGTES